MYPPYRKVLTMTPPQADAEADGQMVDLYGVPCDVHLVRTFGDGSSLGGGYDLRRPSEWFVYDREAGATGNGVWHKHCGPYSTFEQAKDWIHAIREDA